MTTSNPPPTTATIPPSLPPILPTDFDFETAIQELFTPHINPDYMTTARASTTATTLPETLYPKLAHLLSLSGKKSWSLRPRTYTILRIINRLDAMNAFVSEGLYDISIPYSLRTLPDILKNPSARAKFFEVQPLVLCLQASAVESGEGRHRHFAEDGDLHFVPVRELGSGGFGDVHLVLSRLSRNQFARKRLPRGRTFEKDKVQIMSFERELETLKRLSHGHLVKYVGSYTDKRYVGILMSPVADCDLLAFLKVVPFPAEKRGDLRRFYGCLTSALLYLHENKIRHKDIKPSNILVHGSNVLITDFGTSRDWSGLDKSTTESRLNGVTRRYAAPEVLGWLPRNSAADIYSLGCVFLEMTTVLRGETWDQLDDYFHSHGTLESSIFSNREAADSWMVHLQAQPYPSDDNDPLEWTKLMIQEDPKNRPTVFRLREMITSSQGAFMGTCCALELDEESDSSYEGSIIEEGIASEETATRLLKDKGFHTNIWNTDALRWAAGEGEIAVARLLLKKGANPSIQDADGWTPLHAAASKGHLSIVRLLHEEGAAVNAEAEGGWTSLHWAARNGHDGVVKFLVKRRANLAAKTSTGWTALHWAVKRNYTDIARFLILKGADLAAKDRYGYTPLHLAAIDGLLGMAQLLRDKGADVNITDGNGRMVTQLALENQNYDIIRLLAEPPS